MIEIKDSILDESVKKFFTKNLVCVDKNFTILDTAKKIIETGHRRIPIIKKEGFFKRKKVFGIITAMDILDAYLRNTNFQNKIEDIMVRDFIFCYENDRMKNVIKKFQFSRRGGFPVLNKKNEIVGIITEKDIVNILKDVSIEIPIKNFMTHKPFFIKEGSFVNSLKILVNTRYRKLPIMNSNNEFLGLFIERICLKTIIENKNIEKLKNTDVCLKNIVKLTEEQKIEEAINLMLEKNIGGIPIFKDEKLTGFLTERDIIEKIKIT
ncbi:MAG: CBS domain-containing protein [Candidatus Aenigmatarchaeota archaeon]